MTEQQQTHLDPTPQSIGRFVARQISGPVAMLNLMRFRDVADYTGADVTGTPESGAAAYGRYFGKILPLIEAAGGHVDALGRGGNYLIGPDHERWDAAFVVRFPHPGAFVAFTSTPAYAAAVLHRTAGCEDTRLLPFEYFEAEELFGPDTPWR